MVVPTVVTDKASSSSQTNGRMAKTSCIMNTIRESNAGTVPERNSMFRGVMYAVLLLFVATLVMGWSALTSTAAIRVLRQDVALLSLPADPPPKHLQDRILQLEAALLVLQNDVAALQNQKEDVQMDEESGRPAFVQDEGANAPRISRRKRSPETLRRPSRFMQRPVPVYNKAYGIDLKDGEGLQLYSTLQGDFDDNQVAEVSSKSKEAQRPRRPPPASLLKSGEGIRKRRPRVKIVPHKHSLPSLTQSVQQRNPHPSGGLVQNGDVLYRESLYKDTPGDDDWDAAVSKVQQGGPASLSPLTLPAAPIAVLQHSRASKRPNKKNTRRRRRGSRLTAAHFNGLPAAAGGSGMWEGAEWMEGLGLMSRYKTGGDHVMVAESGIYLVYAQVRFARGSATGFDVRVNGRAEASCSQTGATQPGTCFTSVVTYLPKSSVIRVESRDPQSPVLRLDDGDQASLGLVKLLEAPETYHQLFTD